VLKTARSLGSEVSEIGLSKQGVDATDPVFNGAMRPGQVWAYRKRARDTDCPFERVEFLQPAPKGTKCLVRFVDDQAREEWVPKGRLIVPWDGRQARLESERRMAAVVEVSAHASDTSQYEAVCALVEEWEFIEGVEIGYSQHELCTVQIAHLDEVCGVLGLDADDLRAEPLAFTEEGLFVAPWSLAVKIASRIAELNGEAVMGKVLAEEEKLQMEAIHGETFRHDGEERWIPPERFKDMRDQRLMAMNIVRGWCGRNVLERLDELEALREEVGRLGMLVERAIMHLRRCGQDAIAATMESDLGVPISRLAPPRHRRR
jgi:hypothetical protein